MSSNCKIRYDDNIQTKFNGMLNYDNVNDGSDDGSDSVKYVDDTE